MISDYFEQDKKEISQKHLLPIIVFIEEGVKLVEEA